MTAKTFLEYAAEMAMQFAGADFEAERNDCLVPPVSAQKKMSGIWSSDAVLRYKPRPRQNEKGQTVLGFSFPALSVSNMVSDPHEVAKELADLLNNSRIVAMAYVQAIGAVRIMMNAEKDRKVMFEPGTPDAEFCDEIIAFLKKVIDVADGEAMNWEALR